MNVIITAFLAVSPAFAGEFEARGGVALDSPVPMNITCIGNLMTVSPERGVLSLEDNGCSRAPRALAIVNESGWCFAPEISGVPLPKIKKVELVRNFGETPVVYLTETAPDEFVSCIPNGYTAYMISPTPEPTITGTFYDSVGTVKEGLNTLFPGDENHPDWVGKILNIRVAGVGPIYSQAVGCLKPKRLSFGPQAIRADGGEGPVKVHATDGGWKCK